MTTPLPDTIDWSGHLEDQFCSVAEKAECYAWNHKRAEAFFTNRAVKLDLPVIILSTLAGVSSVGSGSLFPNNEKTAAVAIGGVSIVVSILSTISSYFSFARRAEAHKLAQVQYSKLYRDLKIQMSLPRTQRFLPKELLRSVKEEINRLAENSPLIPEEIVAEFKKKFKEQTDISRPEELNGLEAVKAQQKSQRHLRNIVENKMVSGLRLPKHEEDEEEEAELDKMEKGLSVRIPTGPVSAVEKNEPVS